MAEKEYIERDAAIADLELYETQVVKNEYALAIAGCRSHIRKLPAADVRPVVRATWYDDGLYGMIEGCFCSCSVCKAQNVGESNYCPNCGAYMREETDNGN